jgi:2-C-methyl-D-erythritol 2,4-cyclodiphosphate synthase
MKLRIGHGFDSHRLEDGEGMRLGGVWVPCRYAIVAHSDGDVLIHALCDALLGAIAGGDIGHLFPPDDPRYADADSRELLRTVMRRVSEAGFRLGNADLTLIAEAPRVKAVVTAMREELAGLLGAELSAVSVKATTNEGMGHLGRREGIAAHAVVLLQGAAESP